MVVSFDVLVACEKEQFFMSIFLHKSYPACKVYYESKLFLHCKGNGGVMFVLANR
jgi:hypothetical protein